jgi:hypothetical protein
MNGRDEYVEECADYLRELAGRRLYSNDEAAAVLRHLKATEKALVAAQSEMRRLLVKDVDGRTYRSGLSAAAAQGGHTQITRALVFTQQRIQEITRYRENTKPGRYHLERAAVNLSVADFADPPTSTQAWALAEKMLAAAGIDYDPPTSRTISNWLNANLSRN